jgi:hypothetical protein
MNLLIMQFSPDSRYFLLSGPNILLGTLFQNIHQQMDHFHKEEGKLVHYFISSSIFLLTHSHEATAELTRV